MDDLFQSSILGIIQGLSEFLPISSTAHLILAPYFFEFEDPGLGFDVALHIGTLFAVVAYFWRDWMDIFKLAFKKTSKTENKNNLLYFFIIATIPGVLTGYFLEKQAETIFRNPLIIAFTLSFVGLLLFLADKFANHRKNIGEIGFRESLIIGIAQAAAIIPGVSRSGATITAGLFEGLNRADAAKFSFLLSTPIIFGAAALEMPNLFRSGFDIDILVGIFFSAISGYLAIKYLIKFVERIGYGIFFWYRIMLTLAIIFVYFS